MSGAAVAARHDDLRRVSLLVVVNALLLPRTRIPIRVNEEAHCALIADAMARDQRLGLIQPRGNEDPQPLHEIGCLGRIESFRALDKGDFDLVIVGLNRFRIVSELEASTPFRQALVTMAVFDDEKHHPPLAPGVRSRVLAELEWLTKRVGFDEAELRRAGLDPSLPERLNDESVVNMLCWLFPLDIAGRQGLLEAPTLVERAALVLEYMRFVHAQNDRGGQDGQRMQ